MCLTNKGPLFGTLTHTHTHTHDIRHSQMCTNVHLTYRTVKLLHAWVNILLFFQISESARMSTKVQPCLVVLQKSAGPYQWRYNILLFRMLLVSKIIMEAFVLNCCKVFSFEARFEKNEKEVKRRLF